jgi:hypothetical protein
VISIAQIRYRHFSKELLLIDHRISYQSVCVCWKACQEECETHASSS